ncbi:hydroxymethylglutaryl-CoA lyase [Azospirillum halopraeferens]|uniref:hydroxymethylglutaryl-CoA lyase n=1 Tax=Azospirillum halopraeferens TaxID=34010 RepID=UPI0004903267|nr:hydroxymethylglutaryl-CoA lyase [Azospirillum halopraeferens]
MVSDTVEICEVGPRDGLQSVKDFVPTAVKTAWISAEAAAGVREIEVCSFVPERVVPQFADAAAVVALARTIPGLTVAALVPNLRGARDAVAAGVHKLTFTLSVSRSHSLANVRRTPDEQLAEFVRIVAFLASLEPERRPQLSAGLSTVFGCVYEGAVDEREVCRLAAALAEAGADDVSLADTTGHADPAQIRRVVTAVRAGIGERLTALHLHDTRGLGLANALAGLEAGIRSFDAALGGLGGCPFAPGALGNIVTEDLVYMLESMGLRTGIDIGRLLDARRALEAALPGERFVGHIHRAGLPKGFRGAPPATA